MPPFILQRLAERETDLETEEEQTEETGCQPPDKETKQLPAQYYAWSSTGTETEDDGGNQDGDWGPGEEPSTEDEAEMCTEDEDNKMKSSMQSLIHCHTGLQVTSIAALKFFQLSLTHFPICKK